MLTRLPYLSNSWKASKKQQEVSTMCSYKRYSVPLILWLFLVVGCASTPQAQSALNTITNPQGGTIVYGVVDGATSQAAALGSVLRSVHSSCGEKPQVGKVFRVRGTNSDAVFFTVTNHPQGNRQAAGMIIATQTGPKTVEAAMVTDDAARFNSTVNPLLTQLFGVWHPGAAPAGGNAPSAAGSTASGGRGAAPPMRQVTTADGTVTLSLPEGWNTVPNQTGMGMATVTGPQGAILMLNQYFGIWDPNNPGVQGRLRRGLKFKNEIDYPSNADLTKSFADIFQRIRASVGQGPAPLKVDSVQPVSGSQNQCFNFSGQLNPDGTAMRDTKMLVCRSTPNQAGQYWLTFTKCLLPLGASDQFRATAGAIMASFKPDMRRAQAIANAQAAPIIAQMQQTYQAHQQALMSFTQSQIARTKQIGAEATARMQSTEAANEQQWAGFDQQENNISRQGQGFSNYLLDQTVVQNNNVGGTGMVGHATLWNSTADALVKSNPNKYQIVDTPGYWNGVDY
jgi:hypothetical protein